MILRVEIIVVMILKVEIIVVMILRVDTKSTKILRVDNNLVAMHTGIRRYRAIVCQDTEPSGADLTRAQT